MSQEFKLHDYALVYCIRSVIYHFEGPTSPHESDLFTKFTCKDLFDMCHLHNVRQLIDKFPWINAFLNKPIGELWYTLPTTNAVTSELSLDDTRISYFIGNTHVAEVAYNYIKS